jgi:hypothetical protein
MRLETECKVENSTEFSGTHKVKRRVRTHGRTKPADQTQISLINIDDAPTEHRYPCLRPENEGRKLQSARSAACNQDRVTGIRKPLLYPLSYEGAEHSVPTPALTCVGISRLGVAPLRSGWWDRPPITQSAFATGAVRPVCRVGSP